MNIYAAMLEQLYIPIKGLLEATESVLSTEIVSSQETVDSIARYALKNGGKRIRPILFLLAARVAGANHESLPRLAAIVEMLHTASLMHDDVVDDAMIRRGQPSTKAKWGNQVSVLVGDLLLCRASKILVEFGNAKLMEAVNCAIGETVDGELLEIAHQNDININTNVYMDIIKGKTAALFSVSGKAGAIISGVSDIFIEALGIFGFEVGVAFQLIDDAMDYAADERHSGKLSGTDLREGKLTYPLIVALSNATASEKQLIHTALISGHQKPAEFQEISAIIKKYNGIDETTKLARVFAETAKARLSIFKPSIEHDSLIALADYAVTR